MRELEEKVAARPVAWLVEIRFKHSEVGVAGFVARRKKRDVARRGGN